MLKKLNRIITLALMWFCGTVTFALTVIVALQVISRLLKISLPWTEELARFMIVWLTFLGCTLAIYRKGHLSVNFLVDMMPKPAQKVCAVFTRLIMIAFFAAMLYYGIRYSAAQMGMRSTSLNIPMGIVYAVVPFSAVLAIYYIVIDMLSVFGVDVPEYGKEEEE